MILAILVSHSNAKNKANLLNKWPCLEQSYVKPLILCNSIIGNMAVTVWCMYGISRMLQHYWKHVCDCVVYVWYIKVVVSKCKNVL